MHRHKHDGQLNSGNHASAQVLDTKQSPKVAFICARATAPLRGAARASARAAFSDPAAVVAHGAELTNDFAIAFAP